MLANGKQRNPGCDFELLICYTIQVLTVTKNTAEDVTEKLAIAADTEVRFSLSIKHSILIIGL